MTWDDFTKRNFLGATRLMWELETEFGPTQRIHAKEDANEIGAPSPDEGYVQPVLEQRKKK